MTAITTADERLLPVPQAWAGRADFFVVSGFAFDAPAPWQPVRPVFHHVDPARIRGFAKAHLPIFFAAYPRVLWLDPGVLPCTDPADLAGPQAPVLAAFRRDDRTPAAEAAALAATGAEPPDAVADALGALAGHPALDRPGLLDPAVLLLDPSDAAVQGAMVAFWRHLTRGPAADRIAFTLALAETGGLTPAPLPGGALDRSPAFATRGAA